MGLVNEYRICPSEKWIGVIRMFVCVLAAAAFSEVAMGINPPEASADLDDATRDNATQLSATTTPLDPFGIRMLYPTRGGGKTWFNKWGVSPGDIILGSGDHDPNDGQLWCRGNGSYLIYGNMSAQKGQIKLWGSSPRIYVMDAVKKWNNVEVTFYGYTSSFNTNNPDHSYAGLEAVVQTDHSDDSRLCYTRGYGGRMLWDGRCDIEKETCHGAPKGYPQTALTRPWPDSGPMPLRIWVGYKLIARSSGANTKMTLELWRDLARGVNGGDWKKMTEFTDYPGWSASADSCCAQHRGDVLNDPGYLNSVYLRTDALDGSGNAQYYKYFSVREVAALP